jgi:hypothetical protein
MNMSSDGGVEVDTQKLEIRPVQVRGKSELPASRFVRATVSGMTLQSCAGVTPGPSEAFRYRYAWDRMGRKGQACAVLARGKMNSCLVKFEDGYTAVTSRNALRRRKVEDCQ